MKIVSPVHRQYRRRRSQSGQNLVELVLTLPFVLVLIFFLVEAARVSFTYQAVGIAAREGAQVAALYHSAAAGKKQLDFQLSASGLTPSQADVKQVPNTHVYQATAMVKFTPFITGAVATLAGPIKLFGSGFDVGYTAVPDSSIY